MMSKQHPLSLFKLILMITTTVFSFSSMTTAYYMMGIKAIPWFIVSGICYFIPYALILSEYTRTYANKSGGVYSWLKDTFSEKTAFVTAFLWYCSYFIWMISLLMKLIIPLSILLFGKDISTSTTLVNLPTKWVIAGLALLCLLVLTKLIAGGYHSLFAFLFKTSLLMMGLILLSTISNSFLALQDLQQFTDNLITSSQNTSPFFGDVTSLTRQAPFFIFAITAFGGLDTISSLVDKTGENKRKFPNALLISACLILVLYFLLLILWSGSIPPQETPLHLGNLMYGVMGNLARQLAHALQLSAPAATLLYQLFIRYTACTILFAYLGLLSSILMSPLKSLIQGTPKEFWPSKLVTVNQQMIPVTALRLQGLILGGCILLISLGGDTISGLFNQLTYMTNISRAIPYFIVALSYASFRKSPKFSMKETLIPYNWQGNLIVFSVCTSIVLAVLFQVYEPLQLGDYPKALSLLLGPVLFGITGKTIFSFIKKRRTFY